MFLISLSFEESLTLFTLNLNIRMIVNLKSKAFYN